MTRAGLRVLVVDDSAVMRQLLGVVLGSEASIEVDVAADPIIAAGKMARCRPDVILLDLEMPRMDGLTFLRKLMRDDPLPVVVCSGHVGPGSELALRALELGALEIVAKPSLDLRGFLHSSAARLVEVVRSAAAAAPSVRRRRGAARAGQSVPAPARRASEVSDHDNVIALGASTGGTEALSSLLAALPRELPGIVIVQHMPAGFTRAFAERLNQCSPLEIREARHGEPLVPGVALVAPGDRHVRVRGSARRYFVTLDDGPEVSRHRPSVDVLFSSLARAAGPNAVAALLTGMGNDGAKGLLELRRAGARTLAQDEASSVIFGMPREAIELGAVEQVVGLDGMAQAIVGALARTPARARYLRF